MGFNREEFEANDNETANEALDSSRLADRILGNLEIVDDDESEDYMGEVDKRLEVTSYYRELLRGSLFEANSEAARIVEKEVKKYVRERVEILLGIKTVTEKVTAPAPLPFDEQEVTALKMLASKLIGNPALASERKPQEPVLRQVAAPKPAPAPVIARRPTPAAPAPVEKKAKASEPKASAPAAPVAPVVAAPKAPPAEPEQPTKKGRVAGSISKTVVNPETGTEVEITVPKIQRPRGALPFPSAQQMSLITAQQANQSVMNAQSSPGFADLFKDS
ncbi:MAG: hypothetical protein H0U23_17985 [Blastocatellia bacterium]|nr:hypothetical protein [Blastocatellia bacterium]